MSKGRKELNMNPEVWNDIIIKLGEKSKELVLEIDRIRKYITEDMNNVIDNLLLFKSNIERYLIKMSDLTKKDCSPLKECVAGVDSSISSPLRIGPYFISAVSASAVLFFKGPYSEPSKIIEVEIAIAPEKSDPEYALKELQLKMFELEVNMLEKAFSYLSRNCQGGYVFLDGPIVDPPKFVILRGLRERYYEYIKRRSNIISKGFKENIKVIGFVKRVLGSFLHSKIKELGKLKTLNDYTLVTLILQGIMGELIRKHIKRVKGSDYDAIIMTKPFELDEKKTDYKLYKEQKVHVFFFYLLNGLFDYSRRVARIEFALSSTGSNEELAKLTWDISKLVYSWTMPGQPYPLPIILAHRSCVIPKRTSKKLLKEALTRYMTHVLKSSVNLDASLSISLSSQLIS